MSRTWVPSLSEGHSSELVIWRQWAKTLSVSPFPSGDDVPESAAAVEHRISENEKLKSSNFENFKTCIFFVRCISRPFRCSGCSRRCTGSYFQSFLKDLKEKVCEKQNARFFCSFLCKEVSRRSRVVIPSLASSFMVKQRRDYSKIQVWGYKSQTAGTAKIVYRHR